MRLVASAFTVVLVSCAGAARERPAERAEAARTAPEDADDVLSRAEAELAGDRPSAAEALFLRAATLQATDDRPLVGLARARLASGNVPGAVEAAGRALALRDSPEPRALRGRALARQRRFDEAQADLARAVEASPGDASSWALLAAVQANRGDRLDAARAFSRTAALLPAADAARLVWREVRFLPPDPVQPEEALDRCTRAYVALLEGQPLEALREASNGMRFAPEFEWCGVLRAEAMWRSNDPAGAERMVRWAIRRYGAQHEPLRADARGVLAEMLSFRKETAAEAVELARGTLAVRGERAAVLLGLARACDRAGDAACARDAAARLAKLPELTPAVREQAEAWLR